MKIRICLVLTVIGFITVSTAISQKVINISENIIQQPYERVVFSDSKSENSKDGIPLLSTKQQGIVLLGENSGFIENYAAKELKRYINLSMGIDLKIKKVSEVNDDDFESTLFILGNPENNSLIKKLNVKLDEYDLGTDGFFIRAFENPFDKAGNVLVIGGDSRGVLNGVYGFLQKTLGIEWFPPRIHRNYMEYFVNNSIYDAGYYRVRDEHRLQIETYLEKKAAIYWSDQVHREKPAVQDLGMIYDKHQFKRCVVDWSVKNRLNTIVLYVDIQFPLHLDESNRIKDVIQYAHKFGVKVHFFTFTHIASRESRAEYPDIHVIEKKSYKDKDEGTYVVDNPNTLRESTKLMVDLVQEYGIDGIGWHPASERIDRTIEEGKPEYYWETVYVTEYYKAITKVKPDAKIFFVLGWEYMNPPSELQEYLPDEVIAWIVPSRAWTRQYMEEYFANFNDIWFWMYPWYSTEGVFPTYLIERMKKYVKEGADSKILGIVPEMYTFRNHEMNALSLTKFYWNPEMDTEKFKKEFNDKYYDHDKRGNIGFQSYAGGDYWGAYELFRDAYLESKNPAIRDRLKDMAIASLRLIEDAAAGAERMYETCKEAEEIFIEHYLSNEETDLFYIILNELTEKWRKKVTEK